MAEPDRTPAPEVPSESPGSDFFRAAWKLVLDDPAKAIAIAYVWLTAVGYARLFGVGNHFDLNVLDYASPSDFLLAGLRDPFASIIAFLTGLVLLRIWLAGRTQSLWRWILPPVALTILALMVWGNSSYRNRVIDGSWNDRWWAPAPTEVTCASEPKPLGNLRLIAATGDFLLWFQPKNDALPPRVVVIPRAEVKVIKVDHHERK